MSESVKPLPCPNPWCDTPTKIRFVPTASPPLGRGWMCCDCHLHGPFADSQAEAIAAWNTRASDTVPREVADRLADALEVAKRDLIAQLPMLRDANKTIIADWAHGPFRELDVLVGGACYVLGCTQKELNLALSAYRAVTAQKGESHE